MLKKESKIWSISGGNVIKLFLSMIYGLSYKARVFVRIGWKRLSGTSLGTLTYSENLYITDKNNFITLGPEGYNLQGNSPNLGQIQTSYSRDRFHIKLVQLSKYNNFSGYL
jgi:hypothetical protein